VIQQAHARAALRIGARKRVLLIIFLLQSVDAFGCRAADNNTLTFLQEPPLQVERLAALPDASIFRARVIELLPKIGAGRVVARSEVSDVVRGTLTPGIYKLVAPGSDCDQELKVSTAGYVTGIQKGDWIEAVPIHLREAPAYK
jgi:hypothetical protein